MFNGLYFVYVGQLNVQLVKFQICTLYTMYAFNLTILLQ